MQFHITVDLINYSTVDHNNGFSSLLMFVDNKHAQPRGTPLMEIDVNFVKQPWNQFNSILRSIGYLSWIDRDVIYWSTLYIHGICPKITVNYCMTNIAEKARIVNGVCCHLVSSIKTSWWEGSDEEKGPRALLSKPLSELWDGGFCSVDWPLSCLVGVNQVVELDNWRDLPSWLKTLKNKVLNLLFFKFQWTSTWLAKLLSVLWKMKPTYIVILPSRFVLALKKEILWLITSSSPFTYKKMSKPMRNWISQKLLVCSSLFPSCAASTVMLLCKIDPYVKSRTKDRILRSFAHSKIGNPTKAKGVLLNESLWTESMPTVDSGVCFTYTPKIQSKPGMAGGIWWVAWWTMPHFIPSII